MKDKDYILSDYGYIRTFTDKQFMLLNPTLDSICIEDVAHSLSMICRFGGHVKNFYSVGQHSIFVSDQCPDEFKLEGLLHDATEAYYGDMVRPLKISMPNYRELEDKLHLLINKKFKLKNNKKSRKIVKHYDNVAMLTEKRDLKFGVKVDTLHYQLPIKKLKPMSAKKVERLFLDKFEELSNARKSN